MVKDYCLPYGESTKQKRQLNNWESQTVGKTENVHSYERSPAPASLLQGSEAQAPLCNTKLQCPLREGTLVAHRKWPNTPILHKQPVEASDARPNYRTQGPWKRNPAPSKPEGETPACGKRLEARTLLKALERFVMAIHGH